MSRDASAASPVALVDERDPRPVRARIGALLASARTAEFAVGRIRLAALDLTGEEIAGVRMCRVLLGRLDAGMLLDATVSPAPASGPESAGDSASVLAGRDAAVRRLEVLIGFASSGRLEVRSAGLEGWLPDFSVFRGDQSAALLGAHYFGSPYPVDGPSFTAIINDPADVALLATRFETLWDRGHDVLPAIGDVLVRAHALATGAGGHGGGADRAGAAGRLG